MTTRKPYPSLPIEIDDCHGPTLTLVHPDRDEAYAYEVLGTERRVEAMRRYQRECDAWMAERWARAAVRS